MASSTLVRVLMQNGEPAIAVDLTVNGPDGTLTEHVVTNTEGEATVFMPEGGSVSSFHSINGEDNGFPYASKFTTTVVSQASPMSEVRIRLTEYGEPLSDDQMTVQLSFPAKPNATSYRIITPCQQFNTMTNGFSGGLIDCTSVGSYFVWVVALGPTQNPLDYALIVDQQFLEGSTASHALTWMNAQPAPTSFTVTNIPFTAAAASFAASTQLSQPDGFYNAWYTAANVDAPENTEVTQLVQFQAPDARHCRSGSVALQQLAPDYEGVNRWQCAAQVPATDFTWDVSRLSRYQVMFPTDVDASAQPFLVWPGENGDALQLQHSWHRASRSAFWNVIRSADEGPGSPVPFPQIPSTLDEYLFDPGVDTVGETQVLHLDLLMAESFEEALAPDYSALNMQFESSYYTVSP